MPDKHAGDSLNEAIDRYVGELIANRPPLTEADKHTVAAILRPVQAQGRHR